MATRRHRCFCVSKGRPQATADPDPDASDASALASELASQGVKGLRRRAKAAGMPACELEAAMDSDDPEECFIRFLQHQQRRVQATTGADVLDALALELRSLGLIELRKRAKAAGMPASELEAAMDSDEPEELFIDFVVQARLQTDNTDAAYASEDSGTVALRQELGGLRLMALQKRATSAGISDAELENAMDSPDPKASLINLVLEQHASTASADHATRQALRSELNGLRLMALQKRAVDAGVDDEDLEDAMDTDEPKAALIALVLALPEVDAADPIHGSHDKPHFGSAPAATNAPVSVPAPAPTIPTKHVMLSYQWDHQAQVTRVYDMLTRLGITCWMDVKSGMGADIYEGMA
eukprot:COSAG02_NODE_3259_length_7079_cov_30.942693_6_plen_354_part_01